MKILPLVWITMDLLSSGEMIVKSGKNKWLNDWHLFWLITAPISLIIIAGMAGISAWNGVAVSSMVQLSVRLAIPWLYIAFSASSLLILFPSDLTRWLMRNRKFMGLLPDEPATEKIIFAIEIS